MARTHVPPARPIDPQFTPEQILEQVHNLLVRVNGDSDKSTDEESVTYYQGAIDILEELEAVLTV